LFLPLEEKNGKKEKNSPPGTFSSLFFCFPSGKKVSSFGFFLFYSPKGGNCFFFLPLFLPEANETEANEPEAIPLWGKVALFLPLEEKVPFGV
jgi:hypothetical protein